MTEKSGLVAAKSALMKVYGPSVVGSGKTIASDDPRVSSGSIALDMALGGTVETDFGVIVGRVHAFWGDKSGGKSTTAQRIAGIFQGLCRNCWRPVKDLKVIPPTKEELEADPDARWSAQGACDCYATGLNKYPFPIPERGSSETATKYAERVKLTKKAWKKNSYEETVVAYVDTEDAFEKRYFTHFGDPRRILLVRPEAGEDAVDIAHVLAASGCIDLMILDSLAHFTPKDEIEASAHDWQQGLQARIVNKGVRKFISSGAAVKNDHRSLTQIWINQVRMKIGVTFGDPSVKPSGMGQDFAAHVEIRFRGSKGDFIAETYGNASKGEIVNTMVGEQFKFEVTKNKTCGTRGRKGIYEQAPDGTVIEDKYLWKMASKFLITEGKGKNKYMLGELGFKTQADIKEAIQNDPEVRAAVRRAVLARFVPGA